MVPQSNTSSNNVYSTSPPKTQSLESVGVGVGVAVGVIVGKALWNLWLSFPLHLLQYVLQDENGNYIRDEQFNLIKKFEII